MDNLIIKTKEKTLNDKASMESQDSKKNRGIYSNKAKLHKLVSIHDNVCY